VLVGSAQRFIDFVFWAHMIKPAYVIKAFDPAAAITLLVITGVSGYVIGFTGAVVWNRLHRS